MANQSSTLDPFAPTQRTENVPVNPNQQIGGGMGFLNEWGEFLPRNVGQAAAEGGSLLKDAFVDLITEVKGSTDKSSPVENGRSNTPIGNQTEIKFNDKDQAQYEIILRNVKLIGQTEKEVGVVRDEKKVEQEVKDEVYGLSEEQLAVEGNYQSSFKLKDALKSLYNRTWVFMKRIFARKAQEQETSRARIVESRNQAKGFMKEGEMFQGIEKSAGAHWSNTPG